MCGNEHDAEDLVQETFLRAYKQLNKFNNTCAFGTWLYRICVNCSLDLLRARRVREGASPSWLETVAARDPGPERLRHSEEIAELLEPALNQLSEMERAAFILRHCEGCDIEEIARTLGVQPNAAKHSVFRAVQKLRRALEPAWGSTR
jgi:RNA polymerase sigma-70 factor (ECF subfamily)